MDDFHDPFTPFTSAAIYLFIPSLPVTHVLGLAAHCPRAARVKHVLLYPVRGGKSHAIFQCISWVIWGMSILVAVPVLLDVNHSQIHGSHTEVLSGAAAMGSISAEMFMILSLLVFDPSRKRNARMDDQPGSPMYKSRAMLPQSLAATGVMAMGALWVLMAGALLWATEYLENTVTKQVYVYLSGASLLVGITTTYGLGGKMWHADSLQEGESATASNWRFFQPFRGGAAFVATQALGWALFSLALTSLVWLMVQMAAGVAYCIRCWALGTISTMGAAYLVIGLSIWTFKGPETAAKALSMSKATQTVAAMPAKMKPKGAIWLPIVALYLPVHIFNFILVSSFCLAPFRFAVAFWVGAVVLYCCLTIPGEPGHTGMKSWLTANLGVALRAWLGKVEVVHEGAPLAIGARYVFGYHPHGLFPIGAPYLPLLQDFRTLLPGIRPIPLLASVCFWAPVVRDLCSWSGARQVTKRSFVKALDDSGAVILVPGGQAELVHTWRFFKHNQFAVYSKHKGFVRVAIEQRASLVPVVCLGEIGTLRNLFDWPDMQQWTYKNLGFPIPYLVVGRWLTPLPRRTGLKFIIGSPLEPPEHVPGTPADEAAVEKLHAEYYRAVEDLFRKHQPTFAGYERTSLLML